jgi:tetratricopeptide (TPR) repeat protein
VRGELAEAESLLRRCLNEHPGFLGAVLPFASAVLARGADPADVVAEVEESVQETTPSVRFMLGTALYEAGHAEEAEEQFRAVLAAQPDSDPARVALSEALLTQRRYDEAAEAARSVATGGGLAPAARRTEVFAALVQTDREGAEAALVRAGEGGLPSEEAALFSAWLTTTAGRPLAMPLPAESAPMLAVVMEALLRVEEVDAFVSLLPVLDAVELSWRDRQELLATVYLRRGFLDSAADEWIAVCDEAGPDARALIGLAQVAHARELPEDALLFAREAQALEPENAAAERIVERLAAR